MLKLFLALLDSVKMNWDPTLRKLVCLDRAHATVEGEDEADLRMNQIEKPMILRIQTLLEGLERESLAAACRFWLEIIEIYLNSQESGAP